MTDFEPEPMQLDEPMEEKWFPWELLACELRLEIFNFLVEDQDFKALTTALRVSKKWKSEIEFVWRKLAERKSLLKDEEEWKFKGKNWKWLSFCRSIELEAGNPSKEGVGSCKGQIPGTLYEGEWKSNKRHGVGCLVWGNDDRYIGDWQQDCKNGHGFMLWTNGDRYDGWWKSDLREGEASYCYSNGGKYVGGYQADERHGPGKFFWPDGTWFEGVWESGGRKGSGKLYVGDKMIHQEWNESPMANYSRSLPSKFPDENA